MSAAQVRLQAGQPVWSRLALSAWHLRTSLLFDKLTQSGVQLLTAGCATDPRRQLVDVTNLHFIRQANAVQEGVPLGVDQAVELLLRTRARAFLQVPFTQTVHGRASQTLRSVVTVPVTAQVQRTEPERTP